MPNLTVSKLHGIVKTEKEWKNSTNNKLKKIVTLSMLPCMNI